MSSTRKRDVEGELEYIMLNNMSVRERQLSYDFTQMWNLRNKTNGQRGEKREGQTKKLSLKYREHTDGHQRGGGWGMG